MSALVDHARRELILAGWFAEDADYAGEIGAAVMGLIDRFAEQGHSGGSAPLVIDLFDKLARFGVLSPLSGEESEWGEVADGLLQNRRCGSVFKNSQTGIAYDTNAEVYQDPDGIRFAKGIHLDQRAALSFPYTPRTRVVQVNHAGEEIDFAEIIDLPSPESIEIAVVERNGWINEAARTAINVEYYRGLVVAIGELLGPEAYMQDDGGVAENVLCAKVPQLVARALARQRGGA